MSNFGLPEGWESDYDGKRWFYTHKSSGVVQYKWPQPGDEYPDFVADSMPIPILPPEDLLASHQQMRVARPNEPRKQYASGMSATGGPMSMFNNDDFGKTDFLQPDAFMYMGPGAYSEISPVTGDELEQPLPDGTLKLPNSPTQSTAKVSPMGSQKSTPMISQSQIATAGSSNTHYELHSEQANAELPSDPKPAELPHHSVAELPLVTPQVPNTHAAPRHAMFQSSDNMDDIHILDGCPIQPSAQPAVHSPLYYPDPVGFVAEMPTESTAILPFETAPIEMADPRVLAPIEEDALEVPAIPELPNVPIDEEKLKHLSEQRVEMKKKQLAYGGREYPFQPTEDSSVPLSLQEPEPSSSKTQFTPFNASMITAASISPKPENSMRRASAPVVHDAVPESLSEKAEPQSVLASLTTPPSGIQSTPPRSTSSTPQSFPINIPSSIAPDGSTGVHEAPLTLRPGILAENTALPPVETPVRSLAHDQKSFSHLPYPDGDHGPDDAVILDIKPRAMASFTRTQMVVSTPQQSKTGGPMPPLLQKSNTGERFGKNSTSPPKPPLKPAYLSSSKTTLPSQKLAHPLRSDTASPSRNTSIPPHSTVPPIGSFNSTAKSANRPMLTTLPSLENHSVTPLNIRRASGPQEIIQTESASSGPENRASFVHQGSHKPSLSEISMISTSSQELYRTNTTSPAISMVSSVSGSSASHFSPGQGTPGTPNGQGSYFPPTQSQQPLRIPTMVRTSAARRQSIGLANELSRQRKPSLQSTQSSSTELSNSSNLSMSIGPTLSIRPKSGSPLRNGEELSRPKSMFLLNSVSNLQPNAGDQPKKLMPEERTLAAVSELKGHGYSQSLDSSSKFEVTEQADRTTAAGLYSTTVKPETLGSQPGVPYNYKSLLTTESSAAKTRPISLPAPARSTVFSDIKTVPVKPEKEKSKWRLSRLFKGSKSKHSTPEPSFRVLSQPQVNSTTSVNFAPDNYPFSNRPVVERSMTPVGAIASPHPDVDPIDHQDGLRSNSPFVEPSQYDDSYTVPPMPKEAPPPRLGAFEMPVDAYHSHFEMPASPVRDKGDTPLLNTSNGVESDTVSRKSSGRSDGRPLSFVVVESSASNYDKDSGLSDEASLSTVDIAEAQAKPVMRPQLVQVLSSPAMRHSTTLSPRSYPTTEVAATAMLTDTIEGESQSSGKLAVSEVSVAPMTTEAVKSESLAASNVVQEQLRVELMKFLDSSSMIVADQASSPSSTEEENRPITPAGQTLSQTNVHKMQCIIAPLTPRRSPVAKSHTAETKQNETQEGVVTTEGKAGEGQDEGNGVPSSRWKKMPPVDYSGGGWVEEDWS